MIYCTFRAEDRHSPGGQAIIVIASPTRDEAKIHDLLEVELTSVGRMDLLPKLDLHLLCESPRPHTVFTNLRFDHTRAAC